MGCANTTEDQPSSKACEARFKGCEEAKQGQSPQKPATTTIPISPSRNHSRASRYEEVTAVDNYGQQEDHELSGSPGGGYKRPPQGISSVKTTLAAGFKSAPGNTISPRRRTIERPDGTATPPVSPRKRQWNNLLRSPRESTLHSTGQQATQPVVAHEERLTLVEEFSFHSD